jgi:hypothetical protein
METAMWTKMRPVMHGLADVTDTWERFAKYVYLHWLKRLPSLTVS